MAAGSVLGAGVAFALSEYGVASTDVLYGCTAGIVMSTITVVLFPPGGIVKGEFWFTFVFAATVAVMSICVMGWFFVVPFILGIVDENMVFLFMLVGLAAFAYLKKLSP